MGEGRGAAARYPSTCLCHQGSELCPSYTCAQCVAQVLLHSHARSSKAVPRHMKQLHELGHSQMLSQCAQQMNNAMDMVTGAR